jgi:DmsE family decaheme c-type cytochrome
MRDKELILRPPTGFFETTRRSPLPLAAISKSMAAVAALLLASGLRGGQVQESAAAPSGYAGSETCQACHEDIFQGFQKNAHNIVEKQKHRAWEGKACESCHGPGAKHAESAAAEDIKNPSRLSTAAADKTCLTCHVNQPTNVGRVQGGHGKNQVSCTSCHSIHTARKADAKLEQCATCHVSAWAEFQRPYAHKLRTGAMNCVDCHNPHGTFRSRSIQAFSANEPGCFKCHGDKRGPFTFEHAPVRLEGCRTCHEPHGSANPRMLTRHEVRFQCLECHSNIGSPSGAAANTSNGQLGGIPPAFHDLRNPRYRNCTICHIKVHGSHVDRALTR